MSCFSLSSVLRFLTIIGMSLMSMSIYAQSYPNRPITFVVPYGPGGSTDPVARQYAMQLQKALGVEVNIENKPGGSGTIGTGMVVRSKPDGYTLGLATNSILGYQPLVNANLVFKTPDQYQPIVKLGEMPVILVVRADAPWKTFAEFLQHVKDNPGKVRASVSGLRTVPDLLAQEFNMIAGTKLRTVPFTGGSGEALVALPKAIRTRILRRAIYDAGAPSGSITAEHVSAVEALVTSWSGQGPAHLPGGVKVSRLSGRLSLLQH